MKFTGWASSAIETTLRSGIEFGFGEQYAAADSSLDAVKLTCRISRGALRQRYLRIRADRHSPLTAIGIGVERKYLLRDHTVLYPVVECAEHIVLRVWVRPLGNILRVVHSSRAAGKQVAGPTVAVRHSGHQEETKELKR